MTPDQERQLSEVVERLKKVEDEMVRNDSVIKLIQKMDDKIEGMESNYNKFKEEFHSMVYDSCNLKDRQISEARDAAIKISVEHANNNHKQTLELISEWKKLAVGLASFITVSLIGITVYFNSQNIERSVASQKNSTNIDSLTHVIEKIDQKTDKINDSIQVILYQVRENK